MTSHSAYCNRGGYFDRGGYRSKNTRHSSYRNQVTRADGEGRGGYRSLTRYFSSSNRGEHGRLLTFPGYTVGGYGRVGYRSQTGHSSSQIGDSRGGSARHVIRSEEINHSSLLNVGESFYGVGRSLYRSCTSPSPYHNSGGHGRSSGFIVMAITEVGIGLTPANFLHITIVY